MFSKNLTSSLLLSLCLFISGCYEVGFSLNPAGVERVFHANEIFINDNEPFTNTTLVNLTILGSKEQEMYITNDRYCKEGGNLASIF